MERGSLNIAERMAPSKHRTARGESSLLIQALTVPPRRSNAVVRCCRGHPQRDPRVPHLQADQDHARRCRTAHFGRNRPAPGLRREEVALLAASASTSTPRLERGNLNGVSESVLRALARGLRLDEAERARLFDLARQLAGWIVAGSAAAPGTGPGKGDGGNRRGEAASRYSTNGRSGNGRTDSAAMTDSAG